MHSNKSGLFLRYRVNRSWTKSTILSAVSAIATTAVGAAGAQAQDDNTAASEDTIVVVGSRRAGTDVSESMNPVDVIGSETLERVGTTNLNDTLRTLVPSLNVQQFSGQDGSAFIRPFSLRGLSPDQTLVLVNGKRRHRSPLVQITNQPLAAGAQGPDLAIIPSIAISQIEVLRDGAAAQYGSDAIAGVINFRLRQNSDGVILVARYGQSYEGDGDDILLQSNIGLPLGPDGFFNISAEYSNTDPTSRGAQRPNAQALIDAGNSAVPVPAQRWGQVSAEAARMFFNAEMPATESVEAYAFGNYSWSSGATEFFYRAPDARPDIFTSVPLTTMAGGPRFTFLDQFPGGFTPLFGSTIRDMSITGGARGELLPDLQFDLSAALSLGQLQYRISNTVNPSLGPESPTSFNPGEIQQRETRFGADFTYPWDVGGFASPINVAFGGEYREETYEIQAGDPASYTAGPFASVFDPDLGGNVGLAVGSSGFPGLSPLASGEFSRSNWAFYLDLETDVTNRWTLGAAARFEDFSDFGSTFNWKVSSRFEVTDFLAARGSANTGFRAPTPGQSNVREVATNIDAATGGLSLTATLPPSEPLAQFYGAVPLIEETSFNYSGGVVIDIGDSFLLTVDYFNIKIEDRIGLTSRIPVTAADMMQLNLLGIDFGDYASVRFLSNSFDTRTQGIDIQASYELDFGSAGTLNLTGSANYTQNTLLDVQDSRAVNRERQVEIARFNPRWRSVLSATYDFDRFHLLGRLNYYGNWVDAVGDGVPTPTAFDQTFGSEILVDLEASVDISQSVSIAVGANNIFDNYPDRDLRLGQQNNGIIYPQFSPFGYNGGFWYARITANF